MGHYHEHFIRFAAIYLGYNSYQTHYDGSVPFREWFCSSFKTDVRTFRDIKLAYRQGAQKRSMPIEDWARPAVSIARGAGAEIWVTTTRPYNRLDNIDPDTFFWLKRHGIKYDFLIYGEYKYEELASQVDSERVCFVLEDLKEQLDHAGRLFHGDALHMYGSQWNSAHHGLYKTVDATDIIAVMRERIGTWKTEHSLSAHQ